MSGQYAVVTDLQGKAGTRREGVRFFEEMAFVLVSSGPHSVSQTQRVTFSHYPWHHEPRVSTLPSRRRYGTRATEGPDFRETGYGNIETEIFILASSHFFGLTDPPFQPEARTSTKNRAGIITVPRRKEEGEHYVLRPSD